MSGLLQNLPRRKAPAGLSEEIVGRLERQVLLAELDEAQSLLPHATDRGVANRRPSLWPRMAAVAACVALAGGIALLQMIQTDSGVPVTSAGGPEYATEAEGGLVDDLRSSGVEGRVISGVEVATGVGDGIDWVRRVDPAVTVPPAPTTLGGGMVARYSRDAYAANRLVVVSEAPVAESHAEIAGVAKELDLPLKMTRQEVVNDGDRQYLVSTYNGTASGEQVAALNFNFANSSKLNITDGTGLFAAAPQSQQMARIANQMAPELSKQVQREATLQNLARVQSSQQFSQRLRGDEENARGLNASQLELTGRDLAVNGQRDSSTLQKAADAAKDAGEEKLDQGQRYAADLTDQENRKEEVAASSGSAEAALGAEVLAMETAPAASMAPAAPAGPADTAEPVDPQPLTAERRAMARSAPVSEGVAGGAADRHNYYAPPPVTPAAPAGEARPERPSETGGGAVVDGERRSGVRDEDGRAATGAGVNFESIIEERQRRILGVGAELSVADDRSDAASGWTDADGLDRGRGGMDAAYVYHLALLRQMLVRGMPLPYSMGVAAVERHAAGRFLDFYCADEMSLPVEIEVRNSIERLE